MTKEDKFDIGDFVKVDRSYEPSVPHGTIYEIVGDARRTSHSQISIHQLSPKTLSKSKEQGHGSFNADLARLTLLSRTDMADLFDRKAAAIESAILELQQSRDKHLKKAALLRKYPTPTQEIAAEFYEVIVKQPDKSKKLEALQQVLSGRVKENLL